MEERDCMTIHRTVQNTLYIGIDPGLTGALAVLDNADVVALHDTPILTLKVGRGPAAGVVRPHAQRAWSTHGSISVNRAVTYAPKM